MEKKIIKLGNNQYKMNSIKELVSSSSRINKLIKEKKKSLKKSTDYLNNYSFKKPLSHKILSSKSLPIIKENHIKAPVKIPQNTTIKQKIKSQVKLPIKHIVKPSQKIHNIRHPSCASPKKPTLVHSNQFQKPRISIKHNQSPKLKTENVKPKKTKAINSYFKHKNISKVPKTPKNIQPVKRSSKKSKKYNKYEIKYIIHSLKKLVNQNNYKKINDLLKKLKREQVIQLLGHYKIVKYSSKAPTPLLKNLIFNFILGNIHISRR